MESNGLPIISSPCLSYYIFVPSLSKILPNDLFQTFMTEKHMSHIINNAIFTKIIFISLRTATTHKHTTILFS